MSRASTDLLTRVVDSTVPEGPFLHFFWKGRVALYAILKALGIGVGDRVLVPGYTCVVVPAAVCFLGAEPVYVDVDSDTYNLSLARIQAAHNHGLRTKAVIVQHTYGLPADTAPIVSWARQNGIAVIEDCCHAVGCNYRTAEGEWKEVGSLGDAAFFSSQWSKSVSTGIGGWSLTHLSCLAQRLQMVNEEECVAASLRETAVLAAQVAARAMISSPESYWLAQSTYRFLARKGIAIGSSNEAELRGEMPKGYAKRMSSFQHWLLERKLAEIGRVTQHRQRLRELYNHSLAAVDVPVFDVPAYADPILLRYPIRVNNKEDVLARAREERVEIGDWFDSPLHPKEADRTVFGYREGMCPNAEDAARQVVNLPMHPRISDGEVERTVSFLARTAQIAMPG